MRLVSFFSGHFLFFFILGSSSKIFRLSNQVRELQIGFKFCKTHADCYFGGTCMKVGQHQVCQCPQGYDGPNCQYAPSCGTGKYYPLQKEPLGIKSPECSQCHPECKECFGSTNSHCSQCDTCSSGGQCQPKLLQNLKCVDKCSSRFYKNGNNCNPCHLNCKQCDGGSQNSCTACQQDQELKLLNKRAKTCVQNCPFGTYQNEQASECLPCHQNCLSCVGPTQDQCLSCQSSKKRHGWSCLAQCPSGTIETSSSCESICSASDNFSSSHLISDCQKCDPKCQSCTKGAFCKSCKNNYFYNILDGNCYTQCPSGMYSSQTDRICLKCPKNCATCDITGLQCQTCKEGYLKEGNYCNQKCNIGYFQHLGECVRCQGLCKRCINGNIDGCTECFSHPTIPLPSLLDDGKCVESCSQGKVNVNGTCLQICGINSYSFKGNCHSCPSFIIDFSNSEEVLVQIGNCKIQLTEKEFSTTLSLIAVEQARLLQITTHSAADSYQFLKTSSNLIIGLIQSELNIANGSMKFIKNKFSNFTSFVELDSGKQNGASLELKLPTQLTNQSDICASITVVQENIFGFKKIGDFEPPVVDIVAFNCQSKEKVSIAKLSEPVLLKLDFKGSTKTKFFAGRYFNEQLQQWSKLGIQSTLVDGKLELSIHHFSAFTVVQDNQGGVSLRSESPTYLLPVIVLSILLAFMLASGILDLIMCCQKRDVYPHQNSHFQRNHFCWVFYYSFVYNFPIVGFYSYQSLQILSLFRVMWFSNSIWCILLIQTIAYSLLEGAPISSNFKYLVGILTGVILIPSTMLHYLILTQKSIRYRVSAMAKMDSQRHLKDITPLSVIAKTGLGESDHEANGTQIVNELRHVSKIEEQEKKQGISGYAVGFFIFYTFIVWLVSLFVIFKQLPKLDQENQHFFQDIIQCFLAALVTGVMLSFAKIIISSSLAFHCSSRRTRHSIVRCIFVDILTRRVALDLSGEAIGELQPQFQVERRNIPPSQI